MKSKPTRYGAIGAPTSAHLIGRCHLDHVPAEIRGVIRQRWEQLVTTGQPVVMMEQTWLRLDGGVVTAEVTAHLFPNQQRPQVQIVAKDVTERRHIKDGPCIHEQSRYTRDEVIRKTKHTATVHGRGLVEE